MKTGAADEVFVTREVDIADKVRELTGGAGADVAFECSSFPVVLYILINAVKPGSVIVNVSIWSFSPEMDMPSLVLKEIDLHGTDPTRRTRHRRFRSVD